MLEVIIITSAISYAAGIVVGRYWDKLTTEE